MLTRLHHHVSYIAATNWHPEIGYWYCAVHLNAGVPEPLMPGRCLYTHIWTHGMLPRLNHHDFHTCATNWHPEIGYLYCEFHLNAGVPEPLVPRQGLYTQMSNNDMLPRLHHHVSNTFLTNLHPEIGYWYCEVHLNAGVSEPLVPGKGLYT